MQDFPANSAKAKGAAEPKKIERVTSAETVRRKRGVGHRFKDVFFSGDARSASQYMVEEIIVPAIRDTLFDAIQGGIERLVYGEGPNKTRKPSTGSGYNGLGHIAYNNVSTKTKATQQPHMLSRRSRARHDFDELIIPSRDEANEVIDQMFEILSRYGQVSVADLYELTGIQSTHTDMKWGWASLQGAKAVRLRQGGFLLDLPEPEPLG